MNRKKAALLAMLVLIVAVSVPVSRASAGAAKPGGDVVACALEDWKAKAGMVDGHMPRFRASGPACIWVQRYWLNRCFYAMFYCDTYYTVLPPKTYCYWYNGGW